MFAAFVAGKLGEVVESYAVGKLGILPSPARALNAAATKACMDFLRTYAKEAPRDVLGEIMDTCASAKPLKTTKALANRSPASACAASPPKRVREVSPFDSFVFGVTQFFWNSGATPPPKQSITYKCKAWEEYVAVCADGKDVEFFLRDGEGEGVGTLTLENVGCRARPPSLP